MSFAVRSTPDVDVSEYREPAQVIPIRRARPAPPDGALRTQILAELRALASFDDEAGL